MERDVSLSPYDTSTEAWEASEFAAEMAEHNEMTLVEYLATFDSFLDFDTWREATLEALEDAS